MEGIEKQTGTGLSDIRGDIVQLKSDIKTIYKRIDEQLKLSETIHELSTDLKVMNVHVASLLDMQNLMKKDIEALKEKPAKKWDGMIEKILTVFIGAAIGFVMTKLGL